jgi:anaerobic magnesium-protoporphyrin IX monomethyl ester cyclase
MHNRFCEMKRLTLIVPMNRTYVVMPPIGLGYLATIARDHGYEVNVLDSLKEKMDLNDFQQYIKMHPSEIFGISMMTYDFTHVKKYISVIKETYPSSMVILGGPHPSGDFQNILIDYPNADFAFRGEAELGFAEFLTEIDKNIDERDYRNVANLIWRKNNQIIINPWRVIENLDSIKFPAWDLIDPRNYPEAPHGAFAKNFPVAPIIITRGCPFQCTFCGGKTITGNKVRKRSIANVIEEINHLVRHFGIKEIHIEDENFTLHRNLVMEFCKELIKTKLGITWALPAGIRLDTLDAELLGMMQASGCHSFAVGIEFGSDRIHKITNKRLNVAIIKEKIELISNYDIKINGFFMMGIPGETKEEMKQTINLALELPIHRAQFNNFMPLPGSELYATLKKDGKLNNIDTNHFFVHDVGYIPEGMTRNDMKKMQRNAYVRFYLRPKVVLNLLKEVKTAKHFLRLLGRFFDGLK